MVGHGHGEDMFVIQMSPREAEQFVFELTTLQDYARATGPIAKFIIAAAKKDGIQPAPYPGHTDTWPKT